MFRKTKLNFYHLDAIPYKKFQVFMPKIYTLIKKNFEKEKNERKTLS